MRYLKNSYSNSNSAYNTCHASAKSSAGSELKPILELQDFSQNPVVEQTQWKNTKLLHANFTRYDYVTNPPGKVYPQKTQLINLSSPSASFTNATVSGTTVTKDSRYKDESSYIFTAGNPTQVTPHDGVINSYIWDYLNTQPIAKISGAAVNQVAYTSFEADGKGGWSFTGTPTTDSTTPSGYHAYLLTGSNNPSRSGLTGTVAYIVSYWTKNNAAFSITGTVSGYPIRGRSVNGWNYFEHRVSGQTTITIGGSGTIDELRLYPHGALMETYTYSPLLGLNNQSDANNRISYYTYDRLGRLLLVKDQDKNILRKICYNYQGQPGCDLIAYRNVQRSGNFTRNNCGPGFTGSTVTYTVLANIYTSFVSQVDADQMAQNDVNSNGQTYANANGTCTPNITVQGFNTKTSDYTVKFTNNATGLSYTFTLTHGTSTFSNLGTVPSGAYQVQFNPQGPGVTSTFHINGLSQTGISATFSNVSITATSQAYMN